ncbi:MAG: hypothetical protein LBR97_02655 [Dysgonamonadaceae bacterium]|jgi:presenilin-like A22 family membrane protease|nr:hypothetical protein [Dysgonamonadaceae bacterium]
MKDTVITAKRKKTEIITLVVCFIIANLINLYAIIRYKTSYTELFSMLGYILVLTVVLYVFWTVIRLFFYVLRRPKRI